MILRELYEIWLKSKLSLDAFIIGVRSVLEQLLNENEIPRESNK